MMVNLCDAGILRKWQLIFYGTAVNPIRLRSSQGSPLSQAGDFYGIPSSLPTNNYGVGSGDIFSQQAFANLPNIFSVAGSEPEVLLFWFFINAQNIIISYIF